MKIQTKNINTKPVGHLEVIWYRQHGKYPERVKRTRSVELYVVGDWSWNRNYPNKAEAVEPIMRAVGVYDA